MISAIDAECVVDCVDELGEGPLWCTRDQVLYWVDCLRKLIHCYAPDTKSLRQWEFSAYVASLAVREKGGLLVAFRAGFRFFDPQNGSETFLPSESIDFDKVRLNDAKVD